MNFYRHLVSATVCWIALSAWLLRFSAPAATNTFVALPPGSLAYHLATNAVGRAAPSTGSYDDLLEVHAPFSVKFDRFFAPQWSSTFWLKGVHGLTATPIGFSNVMNGQGLPTMVSPRHYLCATHMHPEGYLIGFLDVDNQVHWRKTVQRVDVSNDTSVGLLNADLPPGVGFLPVLPANYTNYLPANLPSTPGGVVQGIGMNQDLCLFSQPMNLAWFDFVSWHPGRQIPSGLPTNWSVTLRAGDSSNPEMLLIGNQLVLVSHNYTADGGPNYATQISFINRAMHLLSTNQQVATDYQLTEFPLTNWPVLH